VLRRRVLLAVTFVVLFGLGWWVGRGSASGDLYANLDLFVEVLQKVRENYVEPVEPKQLVDGATRGMLATLDPFSQFLDERSVENLQAFTHGSFGGIGIEIVVRDNFPTVIAPIEGTPAWEAGITAGDVIVRVNDESTAGLTLDQVATKLRGHPGTSVRVGLRREGDPEEHEVTLERRTIETKSVPYAFIERPGVGYLRLANFSEKSGPEVREAVAKLRAGGAKSLVLDLRSNPGGILDQAVDVAEQFLPSGAMIVYTDGRARGQDARYFGDDGLPETQWPLVVLIDGGSASASEIVAGALQDLDRALVIGRTSFGKGSVQRVYPLRGRNAAIKLTTALYYTPSGRSIHRPMRDSLARVAFGDDEGLDVAPHAAPDAAAARPVFKTKSGRTVHGGGGIAPDVEITPDSLPPLALEIERRNLPFRFANRWANAHADARSAAASPPWREFTAFLREEKVSFDDAALASVRPVLERALRRELGRRFGGGEGAARVGLEGDPVYQRALQALRNARAPGDVFAGIPGSAPRTP
jgi:carboxyl-terminal processing protease